MKQYDYFNGVNWLKIDKEDLQEQLFDYGDIVEIMEECAGQCLAIRYVDGNLVHWQNVYGTWGSPTIVN